MKKFRFVLVIAILACCVIGLYYHFSNKDTSELTGVDVESELGQVIYKNLDSSYPTTPRAVAEFYSRIIMCYYNEDLDDEKLEKLVDQARKLYDDELLKENPKDEHMKSLVAEIEEYKKNKQTILSYVLDDSRDVKKFEYKGEDCVGIRASYFMKKGSNEFEKVYHQYILRKDAKGNWRIMGYRALDSEELSDDE